MNINFLELYSSITKESFNTFKDLKNNLLLHQPSYLIKENKWQITPNTNKGNILNNFYNKYPNGIEGTKKECLILIKNYEYKE